MTDLTSLIEKLEKAEGPDWELDADIGLSVGGLKAHEEFGMAGNWWTRYTDNGLTCAVPSYTSSIDAAVSLAERVLPNWQVNLSIFHEALSEASFGNREAPHARSLATKPALAICLATLRALQQKGSSNG